MIKNWIAIAVFVVLCGFSFVSVVVTGYVSYKVGYKHGLSDMAEYVTQQLTHGKSDVSS